MRTALVLTAVAGTLAAAGALSAGAGGSPPCTNVIRGTSASETLAASTGGMRVLGLEGNDRISGSPGPDCIDGGPGNDRIAGLAGPDTLDGAAGRDLLTGGPGADHLAGGPGADKLSGGAGADTVSDVAVRYEPAIVGTTRVAAGGGADRIDTANGHRDQVHCGSGRDHVVADREDELAGCERKRFLRSPTPQASPRKGGRKQIFMVRFRALEEVASLGEQFSIVVSGPSGCGRIVTSSLGVRYRTGETVRYRLEPFGPDGRSAGRWCRGRYSGTVHFVRGTEPPLRVGTFTFKVR